MPRDAASEAARIEVTRRREPVRATSLPIAAAQQVFRREATARAMSEMFERFEEDHDVQGE